MGALLVFILTRHHRCLWFIWCFWCFQWFFLFVFFDCTPHPLGRLGCPPGGGRYLGLCCLGESIGSVSQKSFELPVLWTKRMQTAGGSISGWRARTGGRLGGLPLCSWQVRQSEREAKHGPGTNCNTWIGNFLSEPLDIRLGGGGVSSCVSLQWNANTPQIQKYTGLYLGCFPMEISASSCPKFVNFCKENPARNHFRHTFWCGQNNDNDDSFFWDIFHSTPFWLHLLAGEWTLKGFWKSWNSVEKKIAAKNKERKRELKEKNGNFDTLTGVVFVASCTSGTEGCEE